MGKYHNKKVKYQNLDFDSIKERNRWADLMTLQDLGEISDLQRQVKYELIPKQDGERAVNYIADFDYWKDGKHIVEDVKSPITRKDKAYIIKRKLMLYMCGIKIQEV